MTKIISTGAELKGVFPALFTPLKNDDPKRLRNTIDYNKAERIIDDLVEAGIDGIVPIGTTGQSATVSPQQHVDFIKFAIEYVDNRVAVIAGAGSNCTRESVDTMNAIQKAAGKVSFLCVTGYYNNPPQEGLIKHFETLTAETGAPIVIYNVPSRTNSYLEPDTLIHLAASPSIIGLKQAVDFVHPGQHRDDTQKILSATREMDFGVLSGEDDGLYALLELGGRGITTATGNIPEAAVLFKKVVERYSAGEKELAKTLQSQLEDFVSICFRMKNPIPLACLFQSPVYQPLITLREAPNGKALEKEFLNFVQTKAPSLQKYWVKTPQPA